MSASKFIGMLMNSRTQAHAFHLTTNSYANHKALQKYYEAIGDLLDDYAEAYMGKYGRLPRIELNKRFMSDPSKAKDYFKALLVRIKKLSLPKDAYLVNIEQEITKRIRATMYMLTLK